jgi:HEAT repeat protein
MSGDSPPDVAHLLRTAIEDGSIESIERWARSGRPGLLLLRGVLTGAAKIKTSGRSQRDEIDNLAAAVAKIAWTNPMEFLDVFADPSLDANSFVLTGLGWIDDPRATRRLASAASAETWSARMEVAIGLGQQRSPEATRPLVSLMKDEHYLVRYHALRSIAAKARLGDAEAIAALREYAPQSEVEHKLVQGGTG